MSQKRNIISEFHSLEGVLILISLAFVVWLSSVSQGKGLILLINTAVTVIYFLYLMNKIYLNGTLQVNHNRLRTI